ncbi:MAG: ArnT family glycosyltransferase [Kiritimatiellia bacterium]
MNDGVPADPRGRPAALWLAALGALVVLLFALIRPAGEFPLNDDWSYARFVQNGVEQGQVRFKGWTSVPLIAQALWGALFCLPFGFSFAALRLSTAVAGLLGTWGMFFLARSAGHDRPTAFAAALTLAVNPLWVNLSQTFMTDVPFAAACIWALAGWTRALADPRARWRWLGFFASLAASLIRHPGVVLPVAFFLATRVGQRDARRSRAAWPAAGVGLALIGFCAYGAAHLGLRPFWIGQGQELLAGLGSFAGWLRMLERAGEIAVYLGLFGLPFALFGLAGEPRRQALARLAWVLPAAALAALGLARMGIRLPLAGNVLFDAGLGPVRLFDVSTCGLPNGFSVSPAWWTLATGLGVAGALLGAGRWCARGRRRAEPPETDRRTAVLLAGCAAGWVVPMLAAGYMDRYLVLLLPLWLLGIVPPAAGRAGRRSRGLQAAAGTVALLLALFSVVATRDYFAWNRARWAALDDLVLRRQVAPERIDGGFEFNGWHRYDPAHPADRQPVPGRSWWWVADDEFAIAMGPVPGYAERARYPFPRGLGTSPGWILVLQREESAP